MKLGIVKFCSFILSLFALAACSGSSNIQLYRDNQPKFVLEQFFNGELLAEGVVKNRSGEVIRRFEASIGASWDEQGVGTLDEHFEFDDGELQQRIWKIYPQADGSYHAKANDTQRTEDLQLSGNAFFMNYLLTLPYKDGNIEVAVDDRMYLLREDLLINESVMRKFGFEVASVVLVIQKVEKSP